MSTIIFFDLGKPLLMGASFWERIIKVISTYARSWGQMPNPQPHTSHYTSAHWHWRSAAPCCHPPWPPAKKSGSSNALHLSLKSSQQPIQLFQTKYLETVLVLFHCWYICFGTSWTQPTAAEGSIRPWKVNFPHLNSKWKRMVWNRQSAERPLSLG